MRKDEKLVPVPVRFARLVEDGLRADVRRLREDLLAEESRLTALEEIRRHCMNDFEERSESGVTTSQAALYYTLFHDLTQEIDLQGKLLAGARRRVHDKQAAATAASNDRILVEQSYGPSQRRRLDHEWARRNRASFPKTKAS